MAVNLTKGENVPLTKDNPGLKKLNVGCGWDASNGGKSIDVDAFAVVLSGGKLKKEGDVVFFNNKNTDGVKHSGDNLTGAGDGDDETIALELDKILGDEVHVFANIYNGASKNQNFGQIKNCSLRVYDADKDHKVSLAKYDLSEDFSSKTAILLGSVYKKDGEWKLKALGEGKDGDINQITAGYR